MASRPHTAREPAEEPQATAFIPYVAGLRPLQVVMRFLVRTSLKSRGGRVGLVIMSLFHLVNMTTKILVAQQSHTHLVTKES